MLMPDWTIKAIYLHQDGCPFESGAGGVLAQHYTTTERVEMLLELGDLSSLGAKIFPDAKTPGKIYLVDIPPWCCMCERD
jgi:hypothetical protein